MLKHRKTHADTCGLIPLTTHRVVNPTTRMKVKVNTPESIKSKIPKQEKEIQEKLQALKDREKQTLELNLNDFKEVSNVNVKPENNVYPELRKAEIQEKFDILNDLQNNILPHNPQGNVYMELCKFLKCLHISNFF